MGTHMMSSASPSQESKLLSPTPRLQDSALPPPPTSVPAPSAPLLAPRCPVIYVHALNALFLPTLPGSASLLGETIPDHPGWVCSSHPPLYRTVALYIDQFFCLPSPSGCEGYELCLIFISVHPTPTPIGSALT